MIAKDWRDVDDVLFFGDKEDILNLRCPDCGCSIEYRACEVSESIEIRCRRCGYISRARGIPENPACVRYFGESYKIPLQEKVG